ncbi:MAG: hypothetical protein JWP35_1222 [Caulobacter sp.]|nr:hypothetical protein [Caulobacter sp.]
MSISGVSASPYVTAPTTSSSSLTAAPAKPKSAEDDFMAMVNMTPAQRIRAAILGGMGLTEEQVKAMDTKERDAIEAKIKAIIKQQFQTQVEKKTGMFADVKV